eukprot:bmy_03505T0
MDSALFLTGADAFSCVLLFFSVKPAVCVAAVTQGSLPTMKDGKGMTSRVIGSMKENVSQDSLSLIFCPSGLLTIALK